MGWEDIKEEDNGQPIIEEVVEMTFDELKAWKFELSQIMFSDVSDKDKLAALKECALI